MEGEGRGGRDGDGPEGEHREWAGGKGRGKGEGEGGALSGLEAQLRTSGDGSLVGGKDRDPAYSLKQGQSTE